MKRREDNNKEESFWSKAGRELIKTTENKKEKEKDHFDRIEAYEKEADEWNDEILVNKPFYHDFNITVSDPEELRANILDLLHKREYTINTNEINSWAEETFGASKLIPLKGRIKGIHEAATKPNTLLAVGMFILGLIFMLIDDLRLFGLLLFLLSFFVAFSGGNRKDYNQIWIKFQGVNDIKHDYCNLKVKVAGSYDTTANKDKNKEIVKEDTYQIYRSLTSKFLDSKEREVPYTEKVIIEKETNKKITTEEKTKFCIQCGAKIKKARFCSECGGEQ